MNKRNNTPNKPVALIYLRVSTTKQAEEGVSLDAQLARCRDHALHLGWVVDEIYTDSGISGRDSIEKRPNLKRLVARARNLRKQGENPVIVVYSLTRLSRRPKLLYELLDTVEGDGFNVCSVTEAFDTTTPSGRAMLGMLAIMAAWEADMVSERTRDALSHAKSQGVQLGQKTMAQLNPELVEEVKKLYATGLYTHRSLADELNRRNVPSPTGRGKWWPNSVGIALKQ